MKAPELPLLRQMALENTDFFPECAGKEVIAAIAAINCESGADAFAHEEGLLVVRVSSDDIFTLAPVDKNKLRKF